MHPQKGLSEPNKLVKEVRRRIETWLRSRSELGYVFTHIGNTIRLVIGTAKPQGRRRPTPPLNDVQRSEISAFIETLRSLFQLTPSSQKTTTTRSIWELELPGQPAF